MREVIMVQLSAVNLGDQLSRMTNTLCQLAMASESVTIFCKRLVSEVAKRVVLMVCHQTETRIKRVLGSELLRRNNAF